MPKKATRKSGVTTDGEDSSGESPFTHFCPNSLSDTTIFVSPRLPDAAPPAKRAKNPQSRVRGKKGALKVVMTMPVDIIWEVRFTFSPSLPLTLQRLCLLVYIDM